MMSNSLRVFVLIVFLSCGTFGILAVFNVIPMGELVNSMGKFSLVAAIVLGVGLAVKTLSPSESKSEPTDPPPQL